MKKAVKAVTTVVVALNMEERQNVMPLVGWQDPFGTFTIDGEEWSIAIGGGCQSIWITTADEKKYVVDIGEIVNCMVKAIQSGKAGGK